MDPDEDAPTIVGSASPSVSITEGDPKSSIVVHVPHASTVIPPWVRKKILLDDDALKEELTFMTDALTDEIAIQAARMSTVHPWIFVNECSRLVVDPERFPESSQEPMAAPEIGMGAIYTRTAHGAVLRSADSSHEAQLLKTYFYPYASALSELVDGRLSAHGTATLIDLHSFPKDELPYERPHHADALRPALCVGVDDFHTPESLVEASKAAFKSLGDCIVNSPFEGTYVPLNRYGTDERVKSVMIELRRDTYLGSEKALAAVARMLTVLIDLLSHQAAEGI